ncbi:MAG TPA: ATP-binding protein [Egibacteraceae bacterium]|nr:ATP-binding protein [Egibacteraceae bacterium]
MKVPPTPGHLALLRTAVGGFAARDHFTLDQVDDLRMAVEESAVQLLRHASGDCITLEVCSTESGVDVRLHAAVAGSDPVIDESSFSWKILRALADDLRIEMQQGHATIVLTKHRINVTSEPRS